MCGITGLYAPRGLSGGLSIESAIRQMTSTLRHRGPDSDGIWLDRDADIALGHRRLAVLDLTPEGHQPMVSDDGRYIMVFNGEIYNFAELQRALAAEGQRFRGRSDTEVLLAAVANWGVARALEAAAGMFALAVWDRPGRTLHLARDRLGKKPLYVGCISGGLAFASELKAFAALPRFNREIDQRALNMYLRRQYVPAPLTIWTDIRKLPAGTSVQLKLDGSISEIGDLDAAIQPYWSAQTLAEANIDNSNIDEMGALDQFERLLSVAISERMVADVPLGAFLSGGIDSSLVVALMQAQSSRPVKTFTVGFGESDYDEVVGAREVAARLGTDHTEINVTPTEAREVIPLLPRIYDEPFADASQIPTWHVARIARQTVTVALSGDGGDELFGGYGRYLLAAGLERRMLRIVPLRLRQVAAAAARALPVNCWDALLGLAKTPLPEGYRGSMTGDRVHKLAHLIAAKDTAALYTLLLDLGAADVLPARVNEALGVSNAFFATSSVAFIHQMMCYDTMTYLPDDVLVKMDRASMAVSLEVRSPLLDHRVVEFAWRLPLKLKVRDGQGKWALRQLLERYLPDGPATGRKMGFGVPIADWLRGPLRAWGEELLAKPRLQQEGLFDAAAVRDLWEGHLSRRHNWAPALWSVLMFQAWREHWQEEIVHAALAPAA